MSYQQVRDILNNIREYHRRFRDTLARVEQESGSEIVEWIAKETRQYEQRWQMALAKDGDEDEDAILQTWIQVVPSEPILEELEAIVVTPHLTVEDVADLAIRFHGALVNFYTTLATQVSAPRAHELFSRLAEMEQSVVAKQAWSSREE